ncbi:MAG: matrixin family metalloprotease [Acidobacteriia bacterium]|nr:matrixin family metalloprotease [Terriglobia bacterium]
MRFPRQTAALVLGWALTVSSAGAYYHYIHYTSTTAPYLPVPEKFDLSVLPNKTVTILVSDAGPKKYSANDNLPSVLTQVRQAAEVWNRVATSDLRVTFGGLYADGTAGVTPGGELVFDDEVPPGLLAITTHTAANSPVEGPNGSFFPITRSVMHFRSDLTQAPGPSYTEGFFLTVVHEMGHALGLQHTFTSSVMSTAVTRATAELQPLDADDIAAVSLLYPHNFGGNTGTIIGTVTAGGAGVHMASVVALRPGGAAVSSLTNPDGTYRIDGIPPGNYVVYVQPLPPTANITPPQDVNGNPVAPSSAFNGVFYPNVSDPSKATVVTIQAGASADGIDFAVNHANTVPVYDVSTYSFYGQAAAHPAYVNFVPGPATIAAAGVGLGSNGKVASGLSATILGTAFLAPGGLRAYGTTPTYLALDLMFGLATQTGPQHMVFSQGNNIYVLPAALKVTNSDPPSITSVAEGANEHVEVTGANFVPNSQVYFDGLPATTTIVDASHAIVIPPPGVSGQTAVVTVYNGDGQNSMFLAPTSLPTYSYPGSSATAPTRSVTLSPSVLPAGARALVDITGVNTNFADGFMSVGFGSSDALVRGVWVLSPTHALVNVQVADSAQSGSSYATVISGFQTISQPNAFQIGAAAPNAPVVEPTLINAVWLPSGVYPGAITSLFGLNLGGAQTTVTINNVPATILYASASQINLVVPASLKAGPAILRLNNGSTNAYPVVVVIGPAPPSITAIENASNVTISASNPAQAGDVLNVQVTGLAPSGTAVAPGRVNLTAGGVDMPAGSVTDVNDTTSVIQFKLDPNVAPGAQIPLTVSIDGKTSLPVYIPIVP